MTVSVHQAQYLPWLGYFDKIARSDCFVFLDCVQYKEREFQNRNKIRRKGGWMWLSVPVLARGRQAINEVAIDNGANWQRQHAGSISTWYGGAAHFGGHFPFFQETYSRQWERLQELNIHIIRYLLEAFDIGTPLVFESGLRTTGTSTLRIIEICKKLHADTYLSGVGGKAYLDERLFEENGIRLRYQEFVHPQYRQRYEPFMPYMSAIDLLFNYGEKSRDILRGEKKC